MTNELITSDSRRGKMPTRDQRGRFLKGEVDKQFQQTGEEVTEVVERQHRFLSEATKRGWETRRRKAREKTLQAFGIVEEQSEAEESNFVQVGQNSEQPETFTVNDSDDNAVDPNPDMTRYLRSERRSYYRKPNPGDDRFTAPEPPARKDPVRQVKLEINSAGKPSVNRVLVGTPTTGEVRIEWAAARYGQATPCNWSSGNYYHMLNDFIPLSYQVADAQNLIVRQCLQHDFEWLILLEHDNVLPEDAFIRWNEYMVSGKYPVVSALYWTKSNPPEPLIYRGLGNGYYSDWMPLVNRARDAFTKAKREFEVKFGNSQGLWPREAREELVDLSNRYESAGRVWVDGAPTGAVLIHHSILRAVWDESPDYRISTAYGHELTRRVFESPARSWKDPETGMIDVASGTSDLEFFHRVGRGGFLEKAGWTAHAKKHPKYWILMDTNIRVRHIDKQGGMFP